MTVSALAAELIRIDSVNPGLVPGTAGESAIVDHLRARLDLAGFTTHVVYADASRPSLVAVAPDPADRPLVLAYEPVWCIGSGRAATPADSAAAAADLRTALSNRRDLRILYGGSVNPGNAPDLLENGGVDGFLVGGASLEAATFAAIARAARA